VLCVICCAASPWTVPVCLAVPHQQVLYCIACLAEHSTCMLQTNIPKRPHGYPIASCCLNSVSPCNIHCKRVACDSDQTHGVCVCVCVTHIAEVNNNSFQFDDADVSGLRHVLCCHMGLHEVTSDARHNGISASRGISGCIMECSHLPYQE
jgi:hypothetical protein